MFKNFIQIFTENFLSKTKKFFEILFKFNPTQRSAIILSLINAIRSFRVGKQGLSLFSSFSLQENKTKHSIEMSFSNLLIDITDRSSPLTFDELNKRFM